MVNKFIVFEGLDGSGSSTQAALLYKAFIARNQSAMLTTEPTDGPIGHLIKSLFRRRVVFGGPEKEFDKMLSFLFAADRVDHLFNGVDGIEQALKDKNVISTRYFYSSLAYHAESNEEMEFIYSLSSSFRKPDIVFYLDIPPEVSVKRIDSRHTKDSYENYEKLCLVYSNYKTVLSKYASEAIVIDGALDINEIHAQVSEAVFQ